MEPITCPHRTFGGHCDPISAIAVFPDKRRIVTGSHDHSLRLWSSRNTDDVEVVVTHHDWVVAAAVSRNGKFIASGDNKGYLAAVDDNTEKHLRVTCCIKGHDKRITSMDFSPDSAVLATVSSDKMMKLWRTDTWQIQGKGPMTLINAGEPINCVRYSPKGGFIAIAADEHIQIWKSDASKRITKFRAEGIPTGARNVSLTWTPDGTRLLSAGSSYDPAIRVWNTVTWKQIGRPWTGYTSTVSALAINPTGTLVAVATQGSQVRLWRLSDHRMVALFDHSQQVLCCAFSAEGNRILSGGRDGKLSEWTIPKHIKETTSKPAANNTTHQCDELLRAGDLVEAHKVYKHMMNTCDNATRANRLEWCTAFKKKFQLLGIQNGNAALTAKAYDSAIKLYSAVIDLGLVTDTIFAQRCKAKLGKMLWKEALIDAEKVIELNPTSYIGYNLKNEALLGGQHKTVVPDTHHPALQSEIRKVIDAQLESAPPRLLDTLAGRLCDRNDQINCFTASKEYKELLLAVGKNTTTTLKHIQRVVQRFFQYVILSHRWEEKESFLDDIQGQSIYELDAVDGIRKLQSFCKVACDRKYRWAWSDTCCIDKSTIIELQQSINSMFHWYRLSALTIIYLSDVLPQSEPGALARSRWVTRGWTVQEFLAPKVVLFYQQDWTLYLDDQSLNHKESTVIMQELAHATGINSQALIAFRPEMRGAREKLQWSSMRITKFEEDIAYSLCGILGVYLSPIYGEKKQNALGRLLQEVIARSGDITCLNWVGESSEFNSCLPCDITSYAAPPFTVPSLSDYEMETLVSALIDAHITELASALYTKLECMPTPRFAHQRLHQPCITFSVTQVKLKRHQEEDSYFTYVVKAKGLRDLQITTGGQLPAFSRLKPIRQKFLLVRPWDRNLLELNHFAELPHPAGEAQSVSTVTDETRTIRSSLLEVDPEAESRAFRLIVRLGQPFAAFLLAEQWSGEYKRVAADHHITAQVKQMTSVPDLMDVRTVEIL